MSVIFIYITTSNEAEAADIAKVLLEDRLAACANIIPGVIAMSRWRGNLEAVKEAVLILKTRATLFEAVEARVKELHSYQTPCITALPATAGHVPFMDWVMAETKP
jgi:periplasmic divalent cation tolerance protein